MVRVLNINKIKSLVYKLGFRPKAGHFLNSAALDFHYKMIELRSTYQKSMDVDNDIHQSNLDVDVKDTSNEPIRHRKR